MRYVIDASIAIKWLVDEGDSAEALMLRARHRLLAPELLMAEIANVLGTKVRRGDMTAKKAEQAAEAILGAGIDLRPMPALLPVSLNMAMELQHPAYDCFYLALALQENCRLVTADKRFLSAIAQRGLAEYQTISISLAEACHG